MTSSTAFLLALSWFTLFQFVCSSQGFVRDAIDPTKGFVSVPLNHSNLIIQKPYNVPEDQRYSFKNGVHKLWVFSTDKPHSPTSKTKPRTEIRIKGYDYSSRIWQFEAYGYVPQGTSGVCIMQVFGASDHATTLMLRVYDGALTYYRGAIIIPKVYNKWFKLNVVHDVDNPKVMVYIYGKLQYTDSNTPPLAVKEHLITSKLEFMHKMISLITWNPVGRTLKSTKDSDYFY